MFILKFFASLILLGFFVIAVFLLISFFIAKNFLNDLNNSLKGKFEAPEHNKTEEFTEPKDIPVAIECKICGTYHAEMPKDGICSCGAKL